MIMNECGLKKKNSQSGHGLAFTRIQLGLQTKESSPTGCLSVLKVGMIMVIITDNQGMLVTLKKNVIL